MHSSFEKIIFLDIGGVLLSNGWGHKQRMAAAEALGFDYAEMNKLHDLCFSVYELGRITLDQYLDIVLFYKEQPFSREEMKECMFRQSAELPDLLPWLIDFKQKHPGRFRFISINNEGKEINRQRILRFGLHRLFDAYVSSGEVGLLKPDPAIFTLALGIAGATPDQCIYFDDRAILAEAATRQGITGYQHTDFNKTKKIFEELAR